MSAVLVTGKGEGLGRVGAQTLSLLAGPFSGPLLMDLADGPRSLNELRGKIGSPPQTTMRGYMRALAAAGVVEKRCHGGFPGYVDYQLTASGQELLVVAEVLTAWLAGSPQGHAELGTDTARCATKALVEGWSSGMVRALSERPLCLTELSAAVDSLSYPAVERRLCSMRKLGLVEVVLAECRGVPYEVSDWLRGSIAPLIAAARWERRWLRGRAPITDHDVEAAFLLTLPLLTLPEDISGTCRLAVHTEPETRTCTAGAIAQVRAGSVASTGTRLDDSTDAWASGPSGAWLVAVADRDVASLEVGGETGLATELVAGLHTELFGQIARNGGREISPPAPVPTR